MSEEVFNLASHKELLSEINDIVKFQHIKKPKRSEPAIKNDEFHLVKSIKTFEDEEITKGNKQSSLSVTSLANVVRKGQKQKKVSNEIQNVFKKEKVLEKPQEKIHADRLKRIIAYDSAKTKLSRWDAVVTKNKNADQLRFPLNQDSAYIKDDYSTNPGFSKFRYKSKIIQDIEKIHNECFPKSEEPIVKSDQTELLTLEEMKERRKELAKLKTRESYKMAKKRLQGKIKSKKYHRLKKKEELKKKLKEFEELKATNPEAALKELEKIEKQRIQERVNLRHKNTGTWAKNMKVRAQYDTTAKQAIEAQLALSRELTQKQQKDSSDSESDDEILVNESTDNPWLSNKTPTEDDVFSGYRKFWEEKNKNEKALKKLKTKEVESVKEIVRSDEDMSQKSASDDESEENETLNKTTTGWIEEDVESEPDDDDEDPSKFINELFDKAEENINRKVESKLEQLKPKLLATEKEKSKKRKFKDKPNVHDPKYLEFARKAQIGDVDEALLEGNEDNDESERLPPSKRLMREIEEIKEEKKAFMRGTKDEIDPDSFLKIKSKHLLTALPKTQEFEDADEDEIENIAAANKMSLAEAFENDDIIHDFVEDVETAEKLQAPESTILPGWGSWGGEGVKTREKIERKKQVKKKDRVIINAAPHESLKKHLVSKVPFPFTTIKDFEASLRVPIGKDFIPSTAHSKLTTESVVTKAGTIIEPMTEDALMKVQDENKKKFAHKKHFRHHNKKKN